MPRSRQFLVLNAAREREQGFASRVGSSGTGEVCFYGTRPSRLLPILMGGLRCGSNSPLMLNGATHGKGIYASDNPSTAIRYSGNTGNGWKHSQLQNYKVMLGCEMANHTPRERVVLEVNNPRTKNLDRLEVVSAVPGPSQDGPKKPSTTVFHSRCRKIKYELGICKNRPSASPRCCTGS
ncbi:hypothetical protein B0T24DRAFT_596027 [Lasiosphaeria ovina]|uniref:Poly [ADP-ribose] polymerase n=1 Tax=Lasiosphaeria ovina TaxID=92902 RepID=A0AAE0K372_9PEZI|nr:hypothetical protein B0T24DRAFT_596027 [Lasiosphaeria ovina]